MATDFRNFRQAYIAGNLQKRWFMINPPNALCVKLHYLVKSWSQFSQLYW